MIAALLERFLEEGLGGAGVPAFIERTLRDFLGCGDPEKGCLHMRCPHCGHHELVAFSCKRRGVCGSCSGRIARDVSEHLACTVLPQQAFRQWVVSWPFAVGQKVAFQPDLAADMEQLAASMVSEWVTREKVTVKTGGVLIPHRFGANLNLQMHAHIVVLDGGYRRDDEGGLRFERTPGFGRAALEKLTRAMYQRLRELLLGRGIELPEDDDGPSEEVEQPKRGMAARRRGLHVYVSEPVRERHELQGLIRYLLRCGIDERKLRALPDGRYAYRLDKPSADGSLELVLSGMEMMDRIASLIPMSGKHTRRYFGVLAGGSKWRSEVVARVTPGKNGEWPNRSRTDWAALLKRVYGIDVLTCPVCWGRMVLVRILPIGADAGYRARELPTPRLPSDDGA